MKKLVLILSILFLTGTVTAISQAQLEEFKDNYNNQSSEVPSFAENIVGGEKINVHIERNNSDEIIGADMDGVKVVNITKGGFADETMNVNTDEDTVQTVLDSDDPFDQVRTELDQNDIEYNSTTTGGKIKLTVLSSLSGLADMLGLSF